MHSIERSPAPPGAMVEVAVQNIDEGKFLPEINAAINKGLRDLAEYEKATESAGNLTVAAVIRIVPVKGTKGLRQILTNVRVSVPTPKRASVAMERAGRLLCQPVGTNDDATQQTFFDQMGRMIDVNGNEQFIDQRGAKADDPPAAIPIRQARKV